MKSLKKHKFSVSFFLFIYIVWWMSGADIFVRSLDASVAFIMACAFGVFGYILDKDWPL